MEQLEKDIRRHLENAKHELGMVRFEIALTRTGEIASDKEHTIYKKLDGIISLIHDLKNFLS